MHRNQTRRLTGKGMKGAGKGSEDISGSTRLLSADHLIIKSIRTAKENEVQTAPFQQDNYKTPSVF